MPVKLLSSLFLSFLHSKQTNEIGGGLDPNWFSLKCWPEGNSCHFDDATLRCDPAGSRECKLSGNFAVPLCVPNPNKETEDCMEYDAKGDLDGAIILSETPFGKNMTCDDGETCSIYCLGNTCQNLHYTCGDTSTCRVSCIHGEASLGCTGVKVEGKGSKAIVIQGAGIGSFEEAIFDFQDVITISFEDVFLSYNSFEGCQVNVMNTKRLVYANARSFRDARLNLSHMTASLFPETPATGCALRCG